MKKGAIVTGGAKRLGRYFSTSLAKEGYDVVLHYNSSEDEALKTKKEIEAYGVLCYLLKRDLLKNSNDLIKEAKSLCPNLEILINSASIFPNENILEISEKNFFDVIKLNSYAPLNLSIQWKKEINKGLIINIIDARHQNMDFTHFSYGLSKKLLYEITKHLSLFFAPVIRVNAIAPGVFLPPEGKNENYLEKILKLVPLKRKGTEEEIHNTLKFLIENEYLTGEVIYLDGGRHLLKGIYGKDLH